MGDVPTREEMDLCYEKLIPQYLKFDLPQYLRTYDKTIYNEQIEEFKKIIKLSSGPGVPYMMSANENGKLFDKLGKALNECVLRRLDLFLQYSTDEVNQMSPTTRVRLGLMDPVRIFVKDEPHLREKLDQGRQRIIMSVSIVDKIIEMIIKSFITKGEIRNWWKIPSKPGMGFCKEDNDCVYNHVYNTMTRPISSDMSGWDWGVSDWMIQEEVELAIKLVIDPSDEWIHFMRIKGVLESWTLFQFSDGLLVHANYKGIKCSGGYNTSCGNSRMRAILATLAGSDSCITAGDDCIEQYSPEALSIYKRYGMRCTGYEDCPTEFEFCSRLYTNGFSYPLNAEKMLMNILHTEPKNELEFRCYLIGFMDELEDHPEYSQLLEILDEVGYINKLEKIKFTEIY